MFNFNFNWFNKKKENLTEEETDREYIDGLEHSLWEIKEEYDFPTEEIDNIVQSKRKNFDFLHKALDKRNKSK
jgi:hypothetical protein